MSFSRVGWFGRRRADNPSKSEAIRKAAKPNHTTVRYDRRNWDIVHRNYYGGPS
jgi:hypothetical protein